MEALGLGRAWWEGEGWTTRACVCLIFLPITGSQDSFPPPTMSAWQVYEMKVGNGGAALSGDSGREGPHPSKDRVANRTGRVI